MEKEEKKTKKVQLEKERDDFKDKWMRTLAEYDNFRKRSEKEKSDWIKFSNEKIILDFCDVLDNFERALATNVDIKNFKSYVKGVDLIFQQFNAVLKKNEVIKIDVEGKEFNPNYHEALSALPSTKKKNTIIGVIQNGYIMKDKVIRYSKVAVSNGEKPE
jgi:molecular chaperone GrpE